MAFSPKDLNNLWAWFNGGSITNTNAGNPDILEQNTISDLSGNGRDLSSINGQGFYASSGALNGRKIFMPNGSKTTKLTTAANFPNLSTGGTIWIIASQNTTSDAGGAFLGAGSSVNMQLRRGDIAGSGWGSIRGGINTDDSNSPETTTHINEDTFYTIRLRYDGTKNYLSINNGVEIELASSGGGYIPTPLTVFKSLSAPYGNKRFAEIIVYTDNKTGNDSDLVEYYLQQNYNHYAWAGSIPTSDQQAIIHFGALPTKKVGDADFAPGATSNSPAAITYTSSNPAVATIVGGNIHIVGTGTTTITASQDATAGYTAAVSVSQPFTVSLQQTSTIPNHLYYSDINPIKFYLPNPDTTYESRDIDDFEFFDSIPEWEELVDYYQPWNRRDIFPLQLLADFGPINFVIKDLDGNVIQTIPFTAVAQSQDIAGLFIYQVLIDLSVLQEGVYRFYLELGIDNKLILQSNKQDICTRHEHSLLLEYNHFQYHEGVVFETGIKFRFRVEGSNKFKTPASIGEDFEDQTLDDFTLDAKAYRIYELIIGDSSGVPPFVIDLVNLIFTCSDVKSDGKGFKKPIDNKWEPNELDGYPLKGWKTELRQSVNRNVRVFINNDPQNSKVSIAINADSKGFGKDTGGTNNIVRDVQ